MATYFRDEQVVELLKQDVAQIGTLRGYARLKNMSPPYLSRVLRGEKPISPVILRALGFERAPYYRKAKP
jgi:hypothetical protein